MVLLLVIYLLQWKWSPNNIVAPQCYKPYKSTTNSPLSQKPQQKIEKVDETYKEEEQLVGDWIILIKGECDS